MRLLQWESETNAPLALAGSEAAAAKVNFTRIYCFDAQPHSYWLNVWNMQTIKGSRTSLILDMNGSSSRRREDWNRVELNDIMPICCQSKLMDYDISTGSFSLITKQFICPFISSRNKERIIFLNGLVGVSKETRLIHRMTPLFKYRWLKLQKENTMYKHELSGTCASKTEKKHVSLQEQHNYCINAQRTWYRMCSHSCLATVKEIKVTCSGHWQTGSRTPAASFGQHEHSSMFLCSHGSQVIVSRCFLDRRL